MDEGSDEDFIAKPRRSYTKRSTNTTTTSIKSARGRAGILKNQPFAPRFSNQNVVAPRPTTESSNPRIVPRPTLRYASAYVPPPVNENRPIKMVLLRLVFLCFNLKSHSILVNLVKWRRKEMEIILECQ